MLRCPPQFRTGTLLILLLALAVGTGVLSSCGPRATHVEIRFGVDAGSADVHTVQFYVHDIELLDEHGRTHPFRLAADAPWQNERVALLDLPRRAAVKGTVEGTGGAYSGIRLIIGVPFELNHANVLTAAAPLDRGEMFWNWQSGHKFLRVDFAAANREWSFHVGSTGCSSASALRPPAQPCAEPNEMRIELEGNPLQAAVRLRLEPLIAAARAANYVACTGNYADDPACKDAYAATGLRPGVAQSLWVLE